MVGIVGTIQVNQVANYITGDSSGSAPKEKW